ncbi:olfactory receptor 52D1-like [Megalops cyprinoides]|uniref:olfactory receptor 52D1-like n=1 Tax=Megalops cyprinoides TaxID=118141 RepID=UPI0018643F0E|nr:olfactory receptor 52D1-like [Megalops cyprinoides]
MENSSYFMYFILSAYGEMGNIRYLFFSIIIIMYIMIVFANSLLIALIIVEKSLHEPMYFFMCSLFVNELYGSTSLFPLLLVNMLSDVHEISRFYCVLQIFCVHTYASIEFSNLAVMAYDRYVSICYPLRYNNIMTPTTVYILIAFIWLYSFGKFSVTLSLTMQLQLCGNRIDKVACDNYSIVRLACANTRTNNIYGLFTIILSLGLPVFLIIYSYAEILIICMKSSKQSRQKALSTCTPHLLSLVNFSFGSLFETLQSRFDMTHVPSVIRIILSIYFVMICPLFSPVIYGARTAKIKTAFKKLHTMKPFPE